ncbi:substrate-binding periplasmic protein [Motilimonas pumila]|uniref:Solute-binding protein family 3/N-terminal domain-containing protein n=1 Tax=Motilimonas pumila TaxID=2303987 RepID=A0A418YHU8_9GAMM|nr:transporter substrate-binding domain-containing protein [Motilimonas pumila]RJG49942.1 hypothetical protein D1Z90_04675 [Motilimonas pumila]
MRLTRRLIYFFSLLISTHCWAQAKLIDVYTIDFPPYIIADEQQPNHVVGIIPDLLNLVFQRLDVEPTYHATSWARAFHFTTKANGVGLIPTMKVAERLEWLHYPATPLLYLKPHIITTPDNNGIHFDGDLKQLATLKVGKLRQARVAPEFDQALAEGVFKVVLRNNTDSLVKSLYTDRIDVITADHRQAAYYSKQMGNQVPRIVGPALGEVPIYIAFNKQQVDQAWVDKFDGQLKQVLAKGALAQIEARYLD